MPRNFENRFPLDTGKLVHVPSADGRQLGNRLIRRIRRAWDPPAYFYHLRRGGHVAAAKSHLENRLFAKLDIQDFFHSITRTKIHRSLRAINFTHADALHYAAESTVRLPNGPRRFVLPYGFVQSPLLASLALAQSAVGVVLRQLSASDLAVSVYVDDIVISSIDDPASLNRAVRLLVDAAGKSGLSFNPEKTRMASSSVEAFNLELRHGSVRIIHSRLHVMADRIHEAGNDSVSNGIRSYVQTVNGAQIEELETLLPRIF